MPIWRANRERGRRVDVMPRSCGAVDIGPALALSLGMTRAHNRRRRTEPMMPIPSLHKAPRDPSVATLGFALFRLVPIYDRAPGEAEHAPVRMLTTTNSMGVLARRGEIQRRF